jgi:CRP-like cAMP-binding protein
MLAEPLDRRHAVERELFLRATIGRVLPSTRQLVDALREVTFEKGTIIYAAGTLADEIFFIMHGRVGLSKPGGLEHEFGPGSVVGILDVEQGRARARTAVALSDVEALVLRAEDRLELLEDSFEHTRAVIRLSAARIDGLARDQNVEPVSRESSRMHRPLLLIEKVFTLRDTAAFRKASIQSLVRLAPAADELRIAAGEMLFEVGAARGLLYVVVSGQVDVQGGNTPVHARFGEASLLGAGAAFGDALSWARAWAVTETVLLRFREEDFYDVMEDHFELARSVLGYLSAENERRLDDVEQAALAFPGPG